MIHFLIGSACRCPYPGAALNLTQRLMTFQKIYDAHVAFVWRNLRRLGLSEADASDATQEVFLVVHRRLADFEGRCKTTTWLTRILTRIARDIRRRAHRRHEVAVFEETSSTPSHLPGPARSLEMQQDLELLDRALRALSEEQREVFVLFELEEMTSEEIGEALEIPAGTVRSRLRLGREKFRPALEREAAVSARCSKGDGSVTGRNGAREKIA